MLIQTPLLLSFCEIQVLQQRSFFEGCLTVSIGISLLCLFISIVCLLLLYFVSSPLDLNDPHVPYLCKCPQSFFFSFPSLLCETLLQESVQHHPAALAFIILDDNFLDN